MSISDTKIIAALKMAYHSGISAALDWEARGCTGTLPSAAMDDNVADIVTWLNILERMEKGS